MLHQHSSKQGNKLDVTFTSAFYQFSEQQHFTKEFPDQTIPKMYQLTRQMY